MTAPAAYPLQWPDGRPRTEPSRRQSALFKTSFASARDELAKELERLGAQNTVLSTNVELRLDGQPYASRPESDDPGVAIYFEYRGQSMCFACDRWRKARDNIQAIRKTIGALRGIERWGSGDMLQQAFSGFQALSAPGREGWRAVLGLKGDITEETVQKRFRALAAKHHPDKGGSHDQMARLAAARDQALAELRA